MINLIMLVGLAGSGKSTIAKEYAKLYNATILSSDEYRERKFGSAEILGDSNKLFTEIHNDAIALLKEGKSVILDSTNLTYKKRKPFLDKIKGLEVNKMCILLATDLQTCLKHNQNRSRNVPEAVIRKMRENFNTPTYHEGWSEIEIVYNYDSDNYDVDEYLKLADNFDQQNVNHQFSLGQHSRKVVEYLVEEKRLDQWVLLAGALHDCGKPYTKVFKNMKGESTDIAHYYFHDMVGSYESLFYLDAEFIRPKEILLASALINYHMRPYFVKTEKAKNKLISTVGEDLYYFLEILNQADRKAH